MGIGCGSVGRPVASDTKGPRFESNHWQIFILNIYCQLYWKDENKEKEAANGQFLMTLNYLSLNKICNNHKCIWMVVTFIIIWPFLSISWSLRLSQAKSVCETGQFFKHTTLKFYLLLPAICQDATKTKDLNPILIKLCGFSTSAYPVENAGPRLTEPGRKCLSSVSCRRPTRKSYPVKLWIILQRRLILGNLMSL